MPESVVEPTVSVVIPMYNDAHYVATAIESVLNQSIKPAEVVVVDDGSTDSSAQVLGRFSDCVQVVKHATNRGLPAARNTGIRETTGNLIAFLDADDAWRPSMVSSQIQMFRETPTTGLCFSSVTDCDTSLIPQRARKYRRREGEHVFDELYLQAFPMPPSTIFVRREVFQEVGLFNESMKRKQDFECWLRIAMIYPVSCIPEPLCLRRVHSASLTLASDPLENLEYEQRCFELCGQFAESHGVRLPLSVQDRQALSLRRRMYEMMLYERLDVYRIYRDVLETRFKLSARDRAATMGLLLFVRVRQVMRRVLRVLGVRRQS